MSVLPVNIQDACAFEALKVEYERLSSGCTAPPRPRPAPPHSPISTCPAPSMPRPACGMSGFWIRHVNACSVYWKNKTKDHDDGLTSGSSAMRTPLFVPGCSPMRECILLFIFFDTKNIRELFVVESKTRIYHGRDGSGRRTAGRRGEAGPGRSERRQNDSHRR